jgi:hypothetical protein
MSIYIHNFQSVTWDIAVSNVTDFWLEDRGLDFPQRWNYSL